MPLDVYLASILLEKNRWGPPPRRPMCLVSEWLPRIRDAGFDGIELWENHWRYASLGERTELVASPVPIRVYNSYIAPAMAGPREIARLASALHALSASLRGIKFNLAAPPAKPELEVTAALGLARQLSPEAALWCECHADSVVDTPETAAAAFSHWPASRFGAMLHPFLGSDEAFVDWLRLMGPRLQHLHLQMRDSAETMIRLTDRPDFARQRLHALFAAGFRGSMSLEFTGGTGQPEEDAAALWNNALGDLALVRKIISELKPSSRGPAAGEHERTL
jgi:sugar phosphate isomerase/epimerase